MTATQSPLVAITGNVTLHNLNVTDTKFTGTGSQSSTTCPNPVTPLAPDASVTCTAMHVVTSADLAVGTFTNTVDATGVSPNGTVTDSGTADVDVTPVAVPPVVTPPVTPPVTRPVIVPPVVPPGATPAATPLAYTGSNPFGAALFAGGLLLLGVLAMAVTAAVRLRRNAVAGKAGTDDLV